jgi:signal transduction histidine kinase
MKKLISHKISIDYVKLVIGVIITVFALSSFFIFNVYKNNQRALNISIEQRAFHLESSLVESFNYIIYLIDFLSRQIGAHGADLEYVNSLYNGFQDDLKVKDLSSWSMFDWLTPDKNIRVTSVGGILPEPVSLADRPNLFIADKNPESPVFNPPTLGKISKQLIIPISKAVNNKAGERLGYINIGVTIPGILSRFEHYDDSISYAMFTDGFMQITAPYEAVMDKNIVDDFKSQINAGSGMLTRPVTYGNIRYTYYYKSAKYPFIFVLGYNPKEQNYILLKDLSLPLAIFLFLGVVALVLSYMMYARVIQPISFLGHAAKRITEEKEVKINLKPGLPVEIINLANQLSNIIIYKRQLLEAKKSIEKANTAKTEFLSSTAHEIRSPLNAIIGFSGMIKKQIFGDNADKYVEYAADIEQSGYELLEFIDDLTDLNKSEAGDFALEKEESLDIEKILTRAIKLNINRANKCGIRINKLIDPNVPYLYADGRRLRQVLVNLISNSVKYSPRNTKIDISVVLKDKKIWVTVADEGFGMNEDQVKIALTKWGRVKNANSDKVDSYGLGLPLAKHLTQLHGAEFLIHSVPDKGTSVSLVFPESRTVYYVEKSESDSETVTAAAA